MRGMPFVGRPDPPSPLLFAMRCACAAAYAPGSMYGQVAPGNMYASYAAGLPFSEPTTVPPGAQGMVVNHGGLVSNYGGSVQNLQVSSEERG